MRMTPADMFRAKMEAHHLHEEIVAAFTLSTANADARRVEFRLEDIDTTFRFLAEVMGYRVESLSDPIEGYAKGDEKRAEMVNG